MAGLAMSITFLPGQLGLTLNAPLKQLWNSQTPIRGIHLHCTCLPFSSSSITVPSNTDSESMTLKPRPIQPEVPANESPQQRITRLCKEGKLEDAVKIFEFLRNGAVQFDAETYVSLLKGCSSIRASRRIHLNMISSGIEIDETLGFKLITTYARLGNLVYAREVFDRLPGRDNRSWNALASGLVKHGRGQDALSLLCEMRHNSVDMDGFTFAIFLRACASAGISQVGEQIHALVLSTGLQNNVYIASGLVDMYAKSGKVASARKVFDKIWNPNVVIWNAMLAGYAQHGFGEEALDLFRKMLMAKIEPDGFTMSTVIRVCTGRSMLGLGMQVHAAVIRRCYELDVVLGTALVDLYSKWGTPEHALNVFQGMPVKNLLTWNVALAGFRYHGRGKEAMEFMERMKQGGVQPNFVTLYAVIMACCNGSLLDEGMQYFEDISPKYSISRQAMHYASVVEILGRRGHLDEALRFVQNIKVQPMSTLWWALLYACRVHGDVQVGKLAAEELLKTQTDKIRVYRALQDIYVAAGKWEDAQSVRQVLKELQQEPPSSWVEIKGKIHVFFEGKIIHLQSDKIYSLLEELRLAIEQKVRYEESRKLFLSEHGIYSFYYSEEQALAFGILNSPNSTHSITVVQNHLISGPCHTALKLISTVVDRHIIVRDSWRFHHFQNGVCSCQDYW